ncbi:helix-turn-helix transcriptional regulator [Streptomyces sp. NPDC097640]|uniref:helix-turn-helix domain-containing protein n=1 Tax=Streptomyces sp. NPDC097640 TaxID=3157229 RepID=UPI00332300F9
MSSGEEIAEFAESLRKLKDRSGRSYGVLAARLHVSASTVHRYCNGDAVPAEYAMAERLARLCGATPEELVALHRRWILADAARRAASGRGGVVRPAPPDGGADAATDDTTDDATDDTTGVAAGPSPDGAAAADQPGRAAGSGAEGGAPPTSAAGPRAAKAAGKARGAADRGRLRSVPAAGGAVGRPVGAVGAGPRVWRTRPWALVLGAAAAAVLAITAVEVRPPSGGERKDAAASPEPSAAPSGSAPPAGPTARGDLKKDDTAHERASASPRGGGRRGSASPSASPGRDGSGGGADGGGSGGSGGGRDDKPGSGTPLTLSTRSHVWESRCDHRYLINRPPSQVAPPPVEQDAAAWASAHGAVHGGTTNVEVTVKGRSESAVVLQDLHVRVVGRRTPLPWSSFAMNNGCGGSLTPRVFSVNLDAARPLAVPTDGNDAGEPIPAVRFPYRVSDTDPEVLLINARTSGCDCDWYLELEWTSGDREGRIRIDDHGAPFRTSSVKGRPEYGYQFDTHVWRRDGQGVSGGS